MRIYVNIKKKYPDFVLDVEFESDCSVLGLLGASGSGKSLTLKCITGIEKPDEGKIVVNDRVLFDSEKKINLPPQKRNVGYLFQNYALFPNMTVYQNVFCVTKDESKTLDYLEKFHLMERKSHYPAQLSGGEQQRVAMARMLSAGPELILLDEPFSALDGHLRSQMELEIMSVLEEEHKPAIFVSHNRDEAYRMTEMIAVLSKGQVVDLKEKHELFQAPSTLASTLLTGCKNVSPVEKCEDGTYYAKDWGIHLKPNPENKDVDMYRYAGVRAHDFKVIGGGEYENIQVPNLVKLCVEREIENTFSQVVLVKTESEAMLYMELSKEEWKEICGRIDQQENLYVEIPAEKIIWMEQ